MPRGPAGTSEPAGDLCSDDEDDMMIYDDAMPAKLIYYPLLGDIICVLLSAFHVEQKAFENHPIS